MSYKPQENIQKNYIKKITLNFFSIKQKKTIDKEFNLNSTQRVKISQWKLEGNEISLKSEKGGRGKPTKLEFYTQMLYPSKK